MHPQRVTKLDGLPFVRIATMENSSSDKEDSDCVFKSPLTIKKGIDKSSLYKLFKEKNLPQSFVDMVEKSKIPIVCVVYKGAIWRQFHYGNEEFIRDWLPRGPCPKAIKENLPTLSKHFLRSIFDKALQSVNQNITLSQDQKEVLSERIDYIIKTMFERRDMLLQK